MRPESHRLVTRGRKIESQTVKLRPLQSTMLAGLGVVASLFAVALQAAGARALNLDNQGTLALALTVGTFLGQIVTAIVVESRLATIGNHGSARTPYWVLVVVLAAAGTSIVVQTRETTVVAILTVLVGLTVSRASVVVNYQWQREIVASCLVVAAGLAVVSSASLFTGWAPVSFLCGGGALAVIARSAYLSERLPAPRLAPMFWVTADTAMTGVTQPLINSAILIYLGPAAAIAYRSASTVSAAVEPFISYLRLRLLREHSTSEMVTSFVLVVGAMVGATVLDLLGLFDLVLASAWRNVTLGTFLAALAARAVTLLGTASFAHLRREGYSKWAFVIRAVSTLQYVGLGLLGALTAGPLGVFLAFGIAELLNALYFRVAVARLSKSVVGHRE